MSKTFAVLVSGRALPLMIVAERFDFYDESRSVQFYDEQGKASAAISGVELVAVDSQVAGLPVAPAIALEPILADCVMGEGSLVNDYSAAIAAASQALAVTPFWRRRPLREHLERLMGYQAEALVVPVVS